MLDLQKNLVKLLKDFVIRDKEKLKRNEVLKQFFKRLKIKIFKRKRKKCKVGLFHLS